MLKRSLHFTPPCSTLRRWIDGFYVESVANSAASPRPYHVRPDDSSYLIVRRYDDGAPDNHVATDRMPHLVGPRSTYKPVDLAGRAATILVRFKPGAASAIFRHPVPELLDTSCTLDAVSRASASRLVDRLSDHLSPHELVDVLQREMVRLAQMASPPDPVVSAVMCRSRAAAGNMSVTEMSRSVSLSSRQLRNRVRGETGMTPKLIARIHRLEFALGLPGRRKDVSPAELALHAGYFDQAHLTREFKSLLGVTPADWLYR